MLAARAKDHQIRLGIQKDWLPTWMWPSGYPAAKKSTSRDSHHSNLVTAITAAAQAIQMVVVQAPPNCSEIADIDAPCWRGGYH
jgi:hypothetical protein